MPWPRQYCRLDGCDRPCEGWGLCRPHYLRWKKYGDPEFLVRRSPGTALNWLRSAITTASPEHCLIWPFRCSRNGYSRVRFEGKEQSGHAVALMLAGFPKPPAPNDLALHSCDNRPCVNPHHLRWGTAADNMADMLARDRSKKLLTSGQEAELYRLYIPGSGNAAELMARFGISRATFDRAIANQRRKSA